MKILFVFPGYGSQRVGMGKELYDYSRLVQEYFEEASSCLDTNFVKLCFASSDVELAKMSSAYPALFLVNSAICGALLEAGIKPDAVAGYGPGELSALFAAGSLNKPDGLYLLSKLTSFYEPMLDNERYKAIRIMGLTSDRIEEIFERAHTESVRIGYYEHPTQHIVAGVRNEIELLEPIFKKAKSKVKPVPLAYGFHSPQVADILTLFKPYMIKVDVKDLSIPLLSSLDGRAIRTGVSMRDRITRSIVEPVQWLSVMKKFSAYDLILEVGPHSLYSDKIKEMAPHATVLSVTTPADIQKVVELCAPRPQEQIDSFVVSATDFVSRDVVVEKIL